VWVGPTNIFFWDKPSKGPAAFAVEDGCVYSSVIPGLSD
jgi:hypothetical protein